MSSDTPTTPPAAPEAAAPEAAAPTTSAPAPKKGSKKVRMTKGMWAKAEAMWETGEYDLTALSKLFGGIRRESLSRVFSKRGIVKGSKTIAADVKRDALAASKDGLVEKARETKDESYKFSKTLVGLGMQLLVEAKRKNQPFATCINDLRALNEAQKIVHGTFETRWKLLGLDKEDSIGDELPELIMRELTEDEVKDLRNRSEKETDEDLKDLRGALIDTDEEADEDDVVDTGDLATAAPPAEDLAARSDEEEGEGE